MQIRIRFYRRLVWTGLHVLEFRWFLPAGGLYLLLTWVAGWGGGGKIQMTIKKEDGVIKKWTELSFLFILGRVLKRLLWQTCVRGRDVRMRDPVYNVRHSIRILVNDLMHIWGIGEGMLLAGWGQITCTYTFNICMQGWGLGWGGDEGRCLVKSQL